MGKACRNNDTKRSYWYNSLSHCMGDKTKTTVGEGYSIAKWYDRKLDLWKPRRSPKAIEYFEKAVIIDPYYKNADKNLKNAQKIRVDGKGLFKYALGQQQIAEKQNLFLI